MFPWCDRVLRAAGCGRHLMEFTLLGAALVGIAALYGVLRWEAGRTNAADCTRELWDMALGAALVGLAVGRLAAMLEDGVNPLTHPADIVIVRAGVDTGFAATAALAALLVLARRDLWWTMDSIAPAALAGLAGWHAGCVVRDACLGTATDLPWGIALEGSEVTRHPVELYAALLLAAAVVALVASKARRRPPPGIIGAAALTAAAVIRLATEPLRPVVGTGPIWWYVAGIAAGLASAAWRSKARKRERPSGA